MYKNQTLFQQALSELKKETGIDHYKLITGDEKERKRLNFKHFQEKMLEANKNLIIMRERSKK